VMTMVTSLEPLWETLNWNNGQPEHTWDWDCFNYACFCPLPPVLLSTLTCSSCWYPEYGWRWAECLFCLTIACPELCSKPPSSVFTMSLYLVFRGRWLDLAYEISGVCALGPKLQFHEY
jgi:hypothetical protein